MAATWAEDGALHVPAFDSGSGLSTMLSSRRLLLYCSSRHIDACTKKVCLPLTSPTTMRPIQCVSLAAPGGRIRGEPERQFRWSIEDGRPSCSRALQKRCEKKEIISRVAKSRNALYVCLPPLSLKDQPGGIGAVSVISSWSVVHCLKNSTCSRVQSNPKSIHIQIRRRLRKPLRLYSYRELSQ